MAARTATAKKTVAAAPPKKTAAAKKTVVRRPAKKSASKPLEEMENAYIPDPSVAARYVGRKVYGVWDATIADDASERGVNILMMGDTGSGKTLFGEAYASHKQRPYYSIPCDVSIDPSALFGRMQPTDTVGKYEWQDGPATQVVRGPCGLADKCKDPTCMAGVLNFSEVNFMPPKIAASAYPLLDGRRYIPLLAHKGEIVRAHKGLVIIADMNPNYRGTMELNEAFKNRFEHKLKWGYDPEVEETLVKSPTLRLLASKLRAMNGVELQSPVSTNMLMEFEAFAKNGNLGLEFATHNFLAAFKPSEQDPISKVFDLNKSKLTADISFIVSESSDDSDEDLEEMEWDEEEED